MHLFTLRINRIARKQKLRKYFAQQDSLIVDMRKAFYLTDCEGTLSLALSFCLLKHFQSHNVIFETISGYNEDRGMSCRIQSLALGSQLF